MRLSVTPSEKNLIDLILSHEEMTKAELVSYTDYSRSKINACIDSLLKKQIIKNNGSIVFTGGRRPKVLTMNGSFGLVAGVDIGATSIALVLADLTGKILARCSEPACVREGPQTILQRVSILLQQLLVEQNFQSGQVFGIGIGVPGPVDFSQGMVVSPPIMPGWDGFPVIQKVNETFPFANVVVDNDVNVMALGEIFKGGGKGVKNLIFVKIGTGIGSGIICNGQIYRGSSGCAGDIGHICVDKNGPVCHCGNNGCLEAMAAGPAIAERGINAALEGRSPILMKYYKASNGQMHANEVGDAAREGDPSAIEIIRDSGLMIGDVLASLVNFYNPDMIVIGGGVSNIGNLLLSSIRRAVLKRSLPLSTRNLSIIFSAMGNDAGVTGATALAIEHVFCVERSSELN